MRGMILAAGKGSRMGDLTLETPKPLLKVADQYLIEYPIQSFVKNQIRNIVINVSYHSEKIKETLGDGQRYQAQFHFSEEEEPLETGGGVYKVLSHFEDKPFVVMSADIITDFPLSKLRIPPKKLAHIILVNNPSYKETGDFILKGNQVLLGEQPNLTFANIGIYRPELFADCKPGNFRLGDIIKKAIANNKVTGEHYNGSWFNVGTPEELTYATDFLTRSSVAAF